MSVEQEPSRPGGGPQPAIDEQRTHGGAIAMFVLSGVALMIASIADLVAYSTAGGIEMPNSGSGVDAAQTAIRIGWPLSIALWWIGLAFTIWVAKRRPGWSTGLVALGVEFAVGVTQIAMLGQAASTGS